MSNKEQHLNQPKKKQIEPLIFIPALLLIVAFCAFVILKHTVAADMMGKAYNFVTYTLGWAYEWYVVVLVGLFLFFVFGPYANKKLGEGKPEFSTLSWWGMMFTTNCGVGVLFWATFEGFSDLQSPPFGIKPFSHEAMPWAIAYPLFHWGPTAWIMYTVFSLAFAYLFFVKKKNSVKISTACENTIGTRLSNGWLGKVIDVVFLFGIIGATATCMGANTPIVSELFSKVFGISHTLSLDAAMCISWAFVIAVIVYTGLHKGIKLFSDFRIYLSLGVIVLVLLLGPTQYILNTFTDAVGLLSNNFLRMSLYIDPYLKTGFPQNWTIFYWAWYMAMVIEGGMYFGRISKGRTVREICVGIVLSCTVGSWLFFGVFSGHMMYVFNHNLVPIAKILASGTPAKACVAIWSTLPLGKFMLVLLFIVAYLSMTTLVNSSVYTMAMVTTKNMAGNEEPAPWNRVFWALAMGAVIVVLLSLNRFKPVQTMTVVSSVPILVIATIIIISFMKDIKRTWGIKHEEMYVPKEVTTDADLNRTLTTS